MTDKTVTLKLFAETASAQRKLDDIYAEAERLGKLNPEIKPKIDKAAVTAGLAVLKRELKSASADADKLSTSAGKAAQSAETLAGSAASAGSGLTSMATPMAGLLTAGVALSPVIATLGIGTLGFGIAAAGVVGPLLKAAQASGGLAKNMHKLNPEQQAAAKSLIGLQTAYRGFEKALAPQVLGDFSTAVGVAGHLLHDLQPVSRATGIALGGFLHQIDAEFKSGTWQQFFGFMAKTAGPDMRLLGTDILGLAHALPAVLEALQPVATGLLSTIGKTEQLTGDIAVLTSRLVTLNHAVPKQGAASGNPLKWLSDQNLIHSIKFVNDLLPRFLQHAAEGAGLVGTMGGKASTAGPKVGTFGKFVRGTGDNAFSAAGKLQTMAAAVTALNTAESTSLSNQLAYTNALLASKQGAIDLRTALRRSHDEIGLHTAAQRNSFSTANTYISDLLQVATNSWKSGHGTDGAATAIRNALPLLEQVKTKNRDYWMELRSLKGWLDKLNAEKQIHDVVKLSGNGSWTFGLSGTGSFPSRHIKGRAAGWLVPGHGSGDTVPAMLTPGEAVVPRHLTAALAPFLHANKVPGFASGGLVPSYAGSVKGLQPWGQHNFDATLTAMTKAFAAAGKAQQAAAFSSVSGPASFGVTRWAGLILKVLAMLGQSSANLGAVEHRMQQESGGNPFAINLTDSNAAAGDPSRGLMQTIGSTFARYRSWALPDNIYNPISNIFAGLNYAEHAYPGRSLSSVMLQPGGYDHGGWLMPGLTLAANRTGRPERVLPPGHSGGTVKVELVVRTGHGATDLDRAIVAIIQKHVTVSGGGDAQQALGSKV